MQRKFQNILLVAFLTILIANLHAQTIWFSVIDTFVNNGELIFIDGHVVHANNNYLVNRGEIHFTGDWENNTQLPQGFNPDTGTYNLAGSTQFIKGNAISYFHHLKATGPGDKVLDIDVVVGKNNGQLDLDNARFWLNTHSITLENNAPGSLTRNSGFIVSETDPVAGLGFFKRKITISPGYNYLFPMGTVNGAYIPFSVEFDETSGNIDYFALSTYPTDPSLDPNNRPLPPFVNDFYVQLNMQDASKRCLERFWVISSPSLLPLQCNLEISYDPLDLALNYNTELIPDSLKIFYTSSGEWNINFQSFSHEWQLMVKGMMSLTENLHAMTLYSKNEMEYGVLYFPNAFTPGKSINHLFFPKGVGVKNFSWAIYNRWGEKIFEENQWPPVGWDGNIANIPAPMGVYVYKAYVETYDEKFFDYIGSFMLIR